MACCEYESIRSKWPKALRVLFTGSWSAGSAHCLKDVPLSYDGTSIRILSESAGDEPLALVCFEMAYAHTFRPPNDEHLGAADVVQPRCTPHAERTLAHTAEIVIEPAVEGERRVG